MAPGQIDTEDALVFGFFVIALAVQLGNATFVAYGIGFSENIVDVGPLTFTVAATVAIASLVWVIVTNDSDPVAQAQDSRGNQVIYGVTAGYLAASLFVPDLIETLLNSAGVADTARLLILAGGSVMFLLTSRTA
jgi:hypothetical protein